MDWVAIDRPPPSLWARECVRFDSMSGSVAGAMASAMPKRTMKIDIVSDTL